MRSVRWVAVAAVLMLAACGSGTQPVADEANVSRSVEGEPADATGDETIGREPSDTSDGETTDDDPSVAGPGLLDLLERAEGRVDLQPQGGAPSIEPRGSADFFDGGRRLRFDEHPELAPALVEYQSSLATRNRGVEPWAQVTLPTTDPLVHRATLVDLVAGIYLSDGVLFGMADGSCPDALDEVRQEFTATEPPSPNWEPQPDGFEHWDYPTETISHHPSCVAEMYDVGELDPTGTALRFRRNLASGILEVLFDSGIYTDERLEPILLIVVTDEAPRGDRPPAPTSTVFEPTSMFLLAVNHCGELPWAYSNFMASDSYTPPTAGHYLEPGPFTSGYVCADQVPDRR